MSQLVKNLIEGADVRTAISEAADANYKKYKAKYIVSSERASRRSDEDHVELYSNKILNVGDSFEMDGLTWYVDEVVSDPDRGIGEAKIKGISKLTGVCTWNNKFYGYIPDKHSYRYYKSDNARFDDTYGKTEEISADEYTEIYSKYAKTVLGRDVNEGLAYVSYSSPKGPQTEFEFEHIAKDVAFRIKSKENPTIEDVIEAFRSLNDDYDDYWVRGLRSFDQQKAFLKDLFNRMAKYGISAESIKEDKQLDVQPVDKYEKDLTFDGKEFYYKGDKVKNLSVENVESLIKYLDFNGVYTRWSLSKDLLSDLLKTIWKAIPAKYNVTVFGGRGLVIHGVKQGNKFIYEYKGEKQSYDGDWYLSNSIKDGDTIILSKNPVPDDIRYSDISNEIGKKHSFDGSKKYSGKKINYEDDLVKVYDKYGKLIYSGIEDYEPMKDSPWKFDSSIGAYRFDDYIKACV